MNVPIRATAKVRAHLGVRRFSVARLLAALVLLIIALPIVENLEGGMVIEAVFLTLVLLLAVRAIGARRITPASIMPIDPHTIHAAADPSRIR